MRCFYVLCLCPFEKGKNLVLGLVGYSVGERKLARFDMNDVLVSIIPDSAVFLLISS